MTIMIDDESHFQNILGDLNNPRSTEETRLRAIRFLKNSIIGNRRKKILFAQMGAVPIVTQILNQESSIELLIQAAATLGSFGKSDAAECVHALTMSNAVHALLSHVIVEREVTQEKQLKLVETCIRSLKIIFETKGELASTFDLLLRNERVVPCLIRLLSPIARMDSINEVTASLIARCCRTEAHQSSILNAGGLESLFSLMFSTYPKSQEAALDALASLCLGNVQIGNKVAQHHQVLSQIMNLIRDSRPNTRLLAVKLVANLNKSGSLQNQLNMNDITCSVLPVLVKLMGDVTVPKDQTPNILATLISGSEELQKAACDANAVSRLVSFLQDTSVSDVMRVNCLNALAELCMAREQGRRLLIESKVLPSLIHSLSDPNEQIKGASLSCIKGLSRAARSLRLALVECGVINSLFQLLSDTSITVQAQACAVIANIVLDFAPIKQYVFEKNGIEILASFAQSTDLILRINSILALNNLVYFSEAHIKEAVLKYLTVARIFELLSDGEQKINEITLNLIRNLIHGHALPSRELTSGHNATRLLTHIDYGLSRAAAGALPESITVQLLFVLCNMTVCMNELQKGEVLNSPILRNIFNLMRLTNKEIRCSIIWILINMTWKGEPGFKKRIEILKQNNCEEKLQEMLRDSNVDVRDRVKQCLEQLSLGTMEPTRILTPDVPGAEEDEDIDML